MRALRTVCSALAGFSLLLPGAVHAAPAQSTASKAPSDSAPITTKAATEELEASYLHVSNDYYKKVEPKTLVGGARTGLVTLLKASGIKDPQLPAVTATLNASQNVRRMIELLNISDARYGKSVPKRRMLYGEIAGLAASVEDRYTLFLTPQARESLNESLDGGNFSGVGLSIAVDPITKELRVDEVIPGGPAMKAGVKDGDYITSIDENKTRGKTTLDDSKHLRGKVGTRVRLEIRRDGKPLPKPIVVTRAIIHDPSVTSRMLPGNIGYVHLTVFGSNTGRELDQILSALEKQGAKAFVLDLRDNGGGYLNAAIDVASNFVPSGAVVSVEDRQGGNTQFDAKDTARTPRPLAVLVNRSTASASEITSGAIQDHGVGVLIGTRTFGKGVVQTIYPLPDGAAIKVTTQHYYTPRGHDINKVGIQPDIADTLKPRVRFGDLEKDTQLRTAIDYLKSKLAKS